jgi:hypothetical protein
MFLKHRPAHFNQQWAGAFRYNLFLCDTKKGFPLQSPLDATATRNQQASNRKYLKQEENEIDEIRRHKCRQARENARSGQIDYQRQ